MARCSIENCTGLAHARGWCQKHYRRWSQHGNPETVLSRGVCSIQTCEEPHQARGWCRKHYSHWQWHGDPLVKQEVTREERFWSKVDASGICWEWIAGADRQGYGRFGADVSGRTVLAHRFAYELLVGPIPKGLVLDHLCMNPPCVNPDHLEPVTQAENLRRARFARVA